MSRIQGSRVLRGARGTKDSILPMSLPHCLFPPFSSPSRFLPNPILPLLLVSFSASLTFLLSKIRTIFDLSKIIIIFKSLGGFSRLGHFCHHYRPRVTSLSPLLHPNISASSEGPSSGRFLRHACLLSGRFLLEGLELLCSLCFLRTGLP